MALNQSGSRSRFPVLLKLLTAVLFCMGLVLMASCAKAVEPVKAGKPTETVKVTLQPGPEAGQDRTAITVEDAVDTPQPAEPAQLMMTTWTAQGRIFQARSFIRFAELAKIPPSAKVISAELHLTGLPSSQATPQGNSSYPGTAYPVSKEDVGNTCVIERLVGPWNPNRLLYSAQPASTPENRATIGPSTTRWSYDATADVTGMVQEMISSPEKNHGFVIKLVKEKTYRCMLFHNSSAKDTAARPKLVVVYQMN